MYLIFFTLTTLEQRNKENRSDKEVINVEYPYRNNGAFKNQIIIGKIDSNKI